jgi:CBS domain-containing protein
MKAIFVNPDGRALPDALARRAVTEVMSNPVVCVTADATLGEALRAMVGSGHRHVVAIHGSGPCLGVLADRVVAAAWAHQADALELASVSSVLEPQAAVVTRSARVTDAARLMRVAGVDAVAVIDEFGHPVGIVTGSDLVALLAA